MTDTARRELSIEAIMGSSDKRFSTLKIYGTAGDPLVDMKQLVEIIGDVNIEAVVSILNHEDKVVTTDNQILLREGGIFIVLYLSKSENGRVFRLFIVNLLRKLREQQPQMLLDTFQETREELAALKVKYAERGKRLYEAEDHVEQLQITNEVQSRQRTIYAKRISALTNQVSSLHIDDERARQYDHMKILYEMYLNKIYIYIVEKPKSLNSDPDQIEEDISMYSTEVPPDDNTEMYYRISKSLLSKKILVHKDYLMKDGFTKLFATMEQYKVTGTVYRCGLETIKNITKEIRDAQFDEAKMKLEACREESLDVEDDSGDDSDKATSMIRLKAKEKAKAKPKPKAKKSRDKKKEENEEKKSKDKRKEENEEKNEDAPFKMVNGRFVINQRLLAEPAPVEKKKKIKSHKGKRKEDSDTEERELGIPMEELQFM